MAKFSGTACDGCGKPIQEGMETFHVYVRGSEGAAVLWKDAKGKDIPIDACTIACLRKASVVQGSALVAAAKAEREKAAAAKK